MHGESAPRRPLRSDPEARLRRGSGTGWGLRSPQLSRGGRARSGHRTWELTAQPHRTRGCGGPRHIRAWGAGRGASARGKVKAARLHLGAVAVTGDAGDAPALGSVRSGDPRVLAGGGRDADRATTPPCPSRPRGGASVLASARVSSAAASAGKAVGGAVWGTFVPPTGIHRARRPRPACTEGSPADPCHGEGRAVSSKPRGERKDRACVCGGTSGHRPAACCRTDPDASSRSPLFPLAAHKCHPGLRNGKAAACAPPAGTDRLRVNAGPPFPAFLSVRPSACGRPSHKPPLDRTPGSLCPLGQKPPCSARGLSFGTEAGRLHGVSILPV